MKTFDYKKEFKDMYNPKTEPSIIDVPTMTYIMVDGEGDPNTSEDYKQSIELLYGIAYGIKMQKKQPTQAEGYFDFVVPPLEGFWDIDINEITSKGIQDKNKFAWTSMIRVPDFVSAEVFASEQAKLSKKKPELDVSKVYLKTITEGLCVQIMHIGSYDEESASIKTMDNYAIQQGYQLDFNERRHHEIYLSDFRKVEQSKLKTIIRHPIKK